ncbi:MAG: Hsp20/alpha crystallin family protein [Fibrobacterota bacterium]
MSNLMHYEPAKLSNWFEDFFDGGFRRELSSNYPSVEVREEKDHFELNAELPGVSKEDIDLELKNGVLTIRGEKKNEKKEEKDGYYYNERSYGTFERSFNIGENISDKDIEASFNDGILRVRLQKKEELKPRRISIK